MSEKPSELELLLQGCRKGNRNSQRKLYEHFYGYALNICLLYTKNQEEAKEIMNDAFFLVFTKINQYVPQAPFKAWLRRIVINSAIDHYRKKQALSAQLEYPSALEARTEELPMPKISADEDLLPILRDLSNAYRVVFNLYVMEEYSHQEIADLLGIDVRTSRSNLVRAKQKIREILLKKNVIRSN